LLHDYLEARGIKFLFVEGLYKPVLDATLQREIVRTYGDVFDFGKVSQILERHARENGIAFISLPQLITARRLDVRQFMHPEDTMHLNQVGILLYARAVADKLNSLGWIASD